MSFDVAPDEDLPVLADHLASMGMRQGPMTAHWLLHALGRSEPRPRLTGYGRSRRAGSR